MSLDILKIQAILFDVDGTLRDTDDQFVLKLERLLYPLRLVLADDLPHKLARRLVMALENIATMIYGIPDRLQLDDELDRVGEFFYRRGLKKTESSFLLIDGVHAMLRLLSSHYPLAIVTARGRRNTMAFLDHYELTPYFQCIATSQTSKYTKPYPDPIFWVAEQMGILPSACLMVGDTTVDIQAGKAAGAQTVGVLCGFGEREELAHYGANLILDTTYDLVHILAVDGSARRNEGIN